MNIQKINEKQKEISQEITYIFIRIADITNTLMTQPPSEVIPKEETLLYGDGLINSIASEQYITMETIEKIKSELYKLEDMVKDRTKIDERGCKTEKLNIMSKYDYLFK